MLVGDCDTIKFKLSMVQDNFWQSVETSEKTVMSNYQAIPRYYPVPEQGVEKLPDIRYIPSLLNPCIARRVWKRPQADVILIRHFWTTWN